jgi:hypothetical protein
MELQLPYDRTLSPYTGVPNRTPVLHIVHCTSKSLATMVCGIGWLFGMLMQSFKRAKNRVRSSIFTGIFIILHDLSLIKFLSQTQFC